jgi:hypothetical protein
VRLELAAEAENEIAEAAEWYDSREPGLGDQLLDEVDHWLAVVVERPAVWPQWPGAPSHEPPVRRCMLSRFGYYAIAYQAFDDHIRVVAFVHTRRKPFYWRARVSG